MAGFWCSCLITFLLQTCISNNSFSNTTMLLRRSHRTSLLLKTITHIDWLTTQVLPLHLINCIIRRFKIIKTYKSILLTLASLRVPHNLSAYNDTELAKHILQLLFVNLVAQITNKHICSYFLSPLVLRCFVHLYCFTKQLYHVQ